MPILLKISQPGVCTPEPGRAQSQKLLLDSGVHLGAPGRDVPEGLKERPLKVWLGGRASEI